jgi:hypothetical protein
LGTKIALFGDKGEFLGNLTVRTYHRIFLDFYLQIVTRGRAIVLADLVMLL